MDERLSWLNTVLALSMSNLIFDLILSVKLSSWTCSSLQLVTGSGGEVVGVVVVEFSSCGMIGEQLSAGGTGTATVK